MHCRKKTNKNNNNNAESKADPQFDLCLVLIPSFLLAFYHHVLMPILRCMKMEDFRRSDFTVFKMNFFKVDRSNESPVPLW